MLKFNLMMIQPTWWIILSTYIDYYVTLLPYFWISTAENCRIVELCGIAGEESTSKDLITMETTIVCAYLHKILLWCDMMKISITILPI